VKVTLCQRLAFRLRRPLSLFNFTPWFLLCISFIVGKSVEVGNSKKYNPALGPVVGQTCDQCGHSFKIGGPIWSNPIHDTQFLADLQADVTKEKESYATFDRINGKVSAQSFDDLLSKIIEIEATYNYIGSFKNLWSSLIF